MTLSKEYINNPAMSQSKLKVILDGVEEFKWNLDHPPEQNEAMKIGTAVHTLVLEPHKADTIVCLPKYSGSTRQGKIFNLLKEGYGTHYFPIAKGKTKKQEDGLFYEVDEEEMKFIQESLEKYGHIFIDCDDYQILSEDDYAKVHAMAKSVLANEDAAALLKSCVNFEVAGEYEYKGIKFKRQYDGMGIPFLLDLKTTRIKNNEHDIRREIIAQKYHFQAASYLIGGTGQSKYFIIFVRSEAPYACFPVELSEELLDEGARLFDQACDLFNDCLVNNPEFKPNNRLRII